MTHKVIKAGCYCRLSEDDPTDGTSISIETQMTIARQYCESNNTEIIDYYCDDGYTGTNFNRPHFKRMLDDIENGRINTVVVKDLSRFGRESSEVNRYIQVEFPEKNIDFIIISENKTITQTSPYDPYLGLMSVINEIYPADVSRKVRQAGNAKSLNGEFLHPFVPYGYTRSRYERNHLVIDEKAARVVVSIFEMVAYKTMNLTQIADYLCNNKVLTPRALYEYNKGNFEYKNRYNWNRTSVKMILDNEVYLGKIIFGKTRKVSFKSNKIIRMDRSDWIICENAHQPIISQELWDETHKKLNVYKRVAPPNKTDNIFSGLLKCIDCNKDMMIIRRTKNGIYYCNHKCPNSQKKVGSSDKCTSHNIRHDELSKVVLMDINDMISKIDTDSSIFRENLVNKIIDRLPNIKRLKIEIEETDKLIKKETLILRKLYDDYVSGKIINPNVFNQLCDDCNKRIEVYSQKRETTNNELLSTIEIISRTSKIDEVVTKVGQEKELTRSLLNSFIDAIHVNERREEAPGIVKHDIIINYKFNVE